MPRRSILALAAVTIATACSRAPAGPPHVAVPALLEAPQYVGVRVSADIGWSDDTPANRARCSWPDGVPFLGNGGFCVPLSKRLVQAIPDRAARRLAIGRGLREIRDVVLRGEPEAPGRRIAVEVMVDTLDVPAGREDILDDWVADVLAASVAERVAVLVNLDTVNWWAPRPDLWTDPANVEATFDEDAWIAWRNWGFQLRVAPPPSLASKGFRDANAAVLRRLLPQLAGHYAALAPEDRWLFAGLVLGTEISVGVNAFYYPNGNAYRDSARPECDPGTARRGDCQGPAASGPCGGYNQNVCPASIFGPALGAAEQLGYKAARTSGWLAPGERMRADVLDRIVVDYVRFLERLARDAGVPGHKVTAHVGGLCRAGGNCRDVENGRAGAAFPGASLYLADAEDPGVLLHALTDSPERARLPWASPEWLPFVAGQGVPASRWRDALEATANHGHNRLVMVANWENVAPDPQAIEGLRLALLAPAARFCSPSPSLDLGHAVLRDAGGGVAGLGVRTSANPGAVVTALVSTSPELGRDGLLASPDVARERVPAGGTFVLARPAGARAWLQLVTTGCGGGKRIGSPVVALETVGGSGAPAPGPRLFTRVEAGRVDLAWELGHDAVEARLEVSTDATFAAPDVLAEDVLGREVRSLAAPGAGTTWFARVVTAGADGAVAASRVEAVRF